MSRGLFIVFNAWVMFAASPMHAQSGTCETAVPPFSANGVFVNHIISENIGIINISTIPVCFNSGIFSPPPHVHLGVWIPPDGPVFNPFLYHLSFSKPIIYLEFFLLVGEQEDFTFQATDCSLELGDILMCNSSIVQNTIFLGENNVGFGHFTISFSEPVHNFNISGSGYGSGSAFQLCSNSITPAPFWAGMTAPEHACVQDSVVFNAYIGGQEVHPPPYTFTYTLNGGVPETISTTGASESISLTIPTTPGTYTYKLLSLTDANGNSVNISCNNTRVVEVQAAPIAQFTASPSSGMAPLEVTTQNQSSNATEYEWLVNGGWLSGAEAPTLTLEEPNTYEITLIASNALGCTDTAKQTIHVLEELQVFIPNVFTPNNDGINDWFGITANVSVPASVVILNRWGNVVFEKDFATTAGDFLELWDGALTGSGSTPGSGTVPDGVYFYRVALDGEGWSEEFTGHVAIRR